MESDWPELEIHLPNQVPSLKMSMWLAPYTDPLSFRLFICKNEDRLLTWGASVRNKWMKVCKLQVGTPWAAAMQWIYLSLVILWSPYLWPGFDPWVGKIPWRKESLLTPIFWPGEFHSPWGHKESDMTERLWHPTPVLLPGKSHGRRSLVGCSPWGSLRVGHGWVTSFSFSFIGEGNGNPLQCSCLENPRDGGARWAAVYGVAQSRTWLKWLSSSSSRAIFAFTHYVTKMSIGVITLPLWLQSASTSTLWMLNKCSLGEGNEKNQAVLRNLSDIKISEDNWITITEEKRNMT